MRLDIKELLLSVFILLTVSGCGGESSTVAEDVIIPDEDIIPDEEYSSDAPDNDHTRYRYLENNGVFLYYETENTEIYREILPDVFDMPERTLVFAFINDFYEVDYGAAPYKENAIFILAEYQGIEVWHCIYMPVTDEQSMWAGIIGLGLPKTLGTIDFEKQPPLYTGMAIGEYGGEMRVTLDTANYQITAQIKNELIDLSLLPSLNIRNGKIIEMGRTGEKGSILQVADARPDLVTVTYGLADVYTNTDTIPTSHALDLIPSRIIGAYYMHNTIPFSLTGSPL